MQGKHQKAWKHARRELYTNDIDSTIIIMSPTFRMLYRVHYNYRGTIIIHEQAHKGNGESDHSVGNSLVCSTQAL